MTDREALYQKLESIIGKPWPLTGNGIKLDELAYFIESETTAAYAKGREDTTKEVYRWLNAMDSHNELTGTEQEGYEVAIEHVRIHLQALKGGDNVV